MWTKTDSGYCTELSDYEAHYGRTNCIVLPEVPSFTKLSAFKAIRDRENEITHWKYKAANGKTYTVFND